MILYRALEALARGEIEVVVYDKTVMHYLINEHQLASKVHLLPVNFNKQYRSFLLPEEQQTLRIDQPPVSKQDKPG